MEGLKKEAIESAEILEKFTPIYTEVRSLLEKYHLNGDFNQEIRGASTFNKKLFSDKIDSKLWRRALDQLDFMSEKQKLEELDGIEKSKLSFCENIDEHLTRLKKQKTIILHETMDRIYGGLTNYFVRKNGRREDITADEVNEKVKLSLFGDLSDGYYCSRNDAATHWLNDLEMIMLMIAGKDFKDPGDRLGDQVKEGLMDAARSKDRFSYHKALEFFNLKVLKSGNVEISFKNGYHVLLNHTYKSCREISLKQYLFCRKFMSHVREDTGCNIAAIQLGKKDHLGAQIVDFKVKNKANKLIYDGKLSVKNLLVSVDLNHPENTFDTIESFETFERKSKRGPYPDLVEFMKETGRKIEESDAEKIDQEAVDFEREEWERKLAAQMEEARKEEGRRDKLCLKRKLKHLLDTEYKCDLSLDDSGLSGSLVSKGTSYNISATERLKIWADHCSLAVDISGQKVSTLKGFINLAIASFELMIDKKSEAKRVINEYKGRGKDSRKIAGQTEPVYELVQDAQMAVNIVHSDMEGTYIDGDTKPIKDELKRFGFAWSWERNIWYVRGSRKREFCEESFERLERLAAHLEGQNIQVNRSYPDTSKVLVMTATREL